MDLIKRHRSRVTKVLLVGGFGFVIQTLVFECLGIWLKVVEPSTATLIGAECAILSNFFLNQRFSFADRQGRGGRWFQLLRFHLVSSGSALIQWVIVLVTEHLTTNVLILHGAYLAGIGLGFVTNYFGYYFFVWRANTL